jgi:hypothetical protein
MEWHSHVVAEELVEGRRYHGVCGLVDVEERWVREIEDTYRF